MGGPGGDIIVIGRVDGTGEYKTAGGPVHGHHAGTIEFRKIRMIFRPTVIAAFQHIHVSVSDFFGDFGHFAGIVSVENNFRILVGGDEIIDELVHKHVFQPLIGKRVRRGGAHRIIIIGVKGQPVFLDTVKWHVQGVLDMTVDKLYFISVIFRLSAHKTGTARKASPIRIPGTGACNLQRFPPCPLRFSPGYPWDLHPLRPKKGWPQTARPGCRAHGCNCR